MSDLVINVRQIGNYPGLSESDGTEQLLVQRGGLGGPYNRMATATLVATALRDGSLEIGNTMPGDASAGQVFADAAVFPPDGWLGLNFYDGNNQGRYWGNGPAAQIGFTLDQPQGITIAMWPSGQSGTPVPSAQQITALTLSTHGDLQLPNGTLTVSRNPGAPMEVATQSYVSATTVASFNQRRGNVQLNEHDLNTALGICAPNFIATDQSVQQRLQELLAGHPFVWSVNGRVGNIWINDQDIAHAYFAPGACPVAPTPPSNSNDVRIPNTEWVNKTLYGTGTNSLWTRLLQTFAPINSPDFTGIPTAPEAPADGNDNQIATVKWVRDHQTQSVGGVASFNLRTGAVTLTQADITNAGGITQASADGRYLQTTGGTLTGNVTQSGASSVISTMGYMYAQRFVVTNNQGATQTGLWGQAGNDSSQMVVGSATGTLSNVTLAAPATSANPLIWGTQTSGANRRWRMQSTGAEQATDNGSGSSFSLAYAVGQFGSWNPVFTVTRNPSITFAVPTSVPTPTLDAHAATKQYVDQASFLPIGGGTILGPISWAGTPTDPSQLATKQYVDATTSQLTTFLGTYNVPNNTPNLVGFVPNNGQYWIVSVGGTVLAAVPGVGNTAVSAGDMLIWDETSGGYVRIAAGGITQAQGDARYLQLTGGTVLNSTPGQQTLLTVANSGNAARILLASIGPPPGTVSTMLALSNNNNRAWGIWPGDNQTTLWLGPVAVGGLNPANINAGSLGITDTGVTIPSNGTLAMGGATSFTMGGASIVTLGNGSSVNFGNLSSVTLGGDPTLPLQAATKQYVDTHVPDLSGYLPLTGGTIGSNAAGSLSPTLTINAPQTATGGYGFNLVINSQNNYGAIFFPRTAAGAGDGVAKYFIGNYGANIRIGYFSTTNAEYPGFAFSDSGAVAITGQRTGGTTGNSGAVTVSTAQIVTAPGTSGAISLSTGTIASSATNGTSGAIGLTTGNNSATGNSGQILLTTGTAAVANSYVGNIILRTGNPGTGAFDGTISLQVGTVQHIVMTNPTGITLGPYGTVPIVLGRDPQALMEAATKQYVDNAIAQADQGFLRLTGGQMTGPLEVLPPVNGPDATNKAYVDAELASLSLFVSTWQVAANIPPLTGQTETDGDYYIAVTANPTVPETAPIGTPGIAGQLVNNGDMVIWSAANGVYDIIRGGPLNVAEANALYVQKIGDTMQGPLTINGTLTMGNGISLGAANASPALSLARHLTLHTAGIGLNASTTLGGGIRYIVPDTNSNGHSFYVGNASIFNFNSTDIYVNRPMSLSRDPQFAVEAATKQYVDAVSAQLANYLPLTGGTLNKPAGSVLSIYSNEDGPVSLGGNNLFLDTYNHRGMLYFPYSGGNYFVGQVGGALQLGHVVTPGGGSNEFYPLTYYQNNGSLTLTSQRPGGVGANSGPLSLSTSATTGTGAGNSGAVTLASGSVAGQVTAGNSGNLTIQTGGVSGSTGTGNSGSITIQTGNDTRSGQFVGSIVINTGTASGGASAGNISLRIGGVNYIQNNSVSGVTLGAGTIPIVLGRDPQNPTEAATKNYVDTHVPDLSGYLLTSGGTITGAINWAGPVTADTNLATKSYVDTAVSAASQFQGTWDVVNNVPDLTQVAPLNGQYWIASSTGTAPAGVPGIGGRTVSSGDTVIYETSLAGFQIISAGGITQPEADARYLRLTGGTLSGTLTMANGINFGASSVNVTVLTRHLMLHTAGFGINVNSSASRQGYVVPSGASHQFNIGNAVPLFIGTEIYVGAPLYLPADPTADLQAATKRYVDAQVAAAVAGGPFLPLSGGQMTGALQVMPPVNANDAASRGYVDSEIASLSVFVSTWQVAANTPPLTGVGESDGDYYIAVTANPNVAETAPASVPGLAGRSIDNGDMVIWSGPTGTYQLIRGGPLNVAEANGLYVQRTGSTMTGPLVLAGDATNGLGATTLNQVNAGLATKLNLTGGTLSGALTLVGNAATGLQAVPLQQLNSTVAGYLALSGGSMTGVLTLVANATAPLQATTLQQMQAADNTKLNLTGGTLSGALILNADPTQALGAATRQYVDSRVPNLSGYLPLTGGTISGNLQIGAGNPQGFPFYVNGSAFIAATVQSTNFLATSASPSAATFAAINPASQTGAGFWYDSTGPVLRLGSTQASGQAATAWLSATPTTVTTTGNLGVGVTPPSTAAPPNPAYGGGWMFGWGATVQNVAANLYWDGTNWRRQNTSTGWLLSMSSTGFQFSTSPAGTSGSLAQSTMLAIIGTNFLNVFPTLYVESGRVVAHSTAATNPAFCVYDQSQSAASAMWEGSSGNLCFGDADGLGNPTMTRMYIDRVGDMTLQGVLHQGSDRRLKRDIRDDTRGLATLARLRPRSFVRLAGQRPELGFVAQELAPVLPEAVGEVMLDGQATLTIAPMMILTVLVNAVNELAEQIRHPRRRRRRL